MESVVSIAVRYLCQSPIMLIVIVIDRLVWATSVDVRLSPWSILLGWVPFAEVYRFVPFERLRFAPVVAKGFPFAVDLILAGTAL
jgi:hypothetical protein